ncbi:hypothetical protein HYX02_07510 [Candidatus Woesearchaeota archaeon]|nr:hypothetical protein [Candidatus Woesearchaeota archaeon]
MFEESKDESAVVEDFLSALKDIPKERHDILIKIFDGEFKRHREWVKQYLLGIQNSTEFSNAIIHILDQSITIASDLQYPHSDTNRAETLGKVLGYIVGIVEFGVTSTKFNLIDYYKNELLKKLRLIITVIRRSPYVSSMTFGHTSIRIKALASHVERDSLTDIREHFIHAIANIFS